VALSFAPTAEKRARLPAQKSSFGFSGTVRSSDRADGTREFETETQNDPTRYAPSFPGATSNLPVLEDAVQGLGSMGFVPEHDGLIRRAPMIFRFGEALYPSLTIEALRVAQGLKAFMVKLGGTANASWLEKQMDRDTGISKIKIGRFIVPTDGKGRIWVYYTKDRGPRTLPAWKVLDKKASISGLKGAIVFVGTSAAGLRDLRATPIDPAMDGVQVHANIAEQILLGEYLKRPDRAGRIEVAFTLAAGLLLLFLLVRLGAAWSAPVGLGMVAGAVWLSWHAYTAWHWLLDPVFPVASLAAVYASFVAVGYIRSEKDRRRITDTFGRYLSPKVVEKLAKNPEGVQLGGETREMTFHFCDIRGFTTISEKFDPHGLTVFINNFLTPMTEIILQHDGTIDKYMGDCIMAFWNAPMNVPDHARRACEAALKMHEKLAALNARWQDEAKAKGISLPMIEIGTGLNTGPCVVGNMGSTLRVDYTVLGDDVNLASRLEGQSKTYGVRIVIGPVTREQTKDFAAVELDLIKVKGKTKPVNIYALLGTPDEAEAPAFRELAVKHGEFLAAYRAARFDPAAKLLKEAAALGRPWRLDKLYHLYEERLDAFRADPPPPGWDGVFTATSK
jgi:adenylate cyclase